MPAAPRPQPDASSPTEQITSRLSLRARDEDRVRAAVAAAEQSALPGLDDAGRATLADLLARSLTA